MSGEMLLRATKAAYGESSKEYEMHKVMLAKSGEISENKSERMSVPKVQKKGDSPEGAELYPADYDFSIVFDTVEVRKLHHKMERKYVDGEEIVYGTD